MLDLSLEHCRYCEEKDITLARYKGTNVKAFSKNHLKNILVNKPETVNGIYAYVYDDDSKLVVNGIVIGYINGFGEVMVYNSDFFENYVSNEDKIKFKQQKGKIKVGLVENHVVVKEISWEEQQRECFDTSWVDSILFSSEAKG